MNNKVLNFNILSMTLLNYFCYQLTKYSLIMTPRMWENKNKTQAVCRCLVPSGTLCMVSHFIREAYMLYLVELCSRHIRYGGGVLMNNAYRNLIQRQQPHISFLGMEMQAMRRRQRRMGHPDYSAYIRLCSSLCQSGAQLAPW